MSAFSLHVHEDGTGRLWNEACGCAIEARTVPPGVRLVARPEYVERLLPVGHPDDAFYTALGQPHAVMHGTIALTGKAWSGKLTVWLPKPDIEILILEPQPWVIRLDGKTRPEHGTLIALRGSIERVERVAA